MDSQSCASLRPVVAVHTAATQLASVLPAASMTVGSINGSIMRRAGSSKYDPLLREIDDGLVDG